MMQEPIPLDIISIDGDRMIIAPSESPLTIPSLFDPFWRVLVTGSRAHDDPALVHKALVQQNLTHQLMTVIHGDCPTGADLFAKEWTMGHILLGMRAGVSTLRHEPYPAYWNELGKSAGPIRNKYMVGLGAHVCLGFPTPSSRGTISCMKAAYAAGIPVVNLGTLPEGVSFP